MTKYNVAVVFYYVYIVTNINRTTLYVGVTNDLSRRLTEHKLADDHEKFTAKYGLNRLVYFEQHRDVRHAIAREKEIKCWRREKKERLIATINPYWRFLNDEEL